MAGPHCGVAAAGASTEAPRSARVPADLQHSHKPVHTPRRAPARTRAARMSVPRIIRFPFGGRGRLKGGSPWLPLQAPVHAFSRELKLKRARVATYATYAAAHSMRRAVRSVPHAVGIPVLLLPPPLHMLRSWCSILLAVEVGTTAMQIKAVCHLHTRSWRRGPPARRSGGGPAEGGAWGAATRGDSTGAAQIPGWHGCKLHLHSLVQCRLC